MSKNRYGLDFEVWGTTLPKNIKKEAAPLQTIAKGWNSSPKPYIAESDATYVAAAVNTEITSTLIKAYFIPDTDTGFNKPCSVRIELIGEPMGPLTIALWAIYKGTDYNLQHFKTAHAKNGAAEEMLTLYYVEQYFDDFYGRGEEDATVEYYAKISCRGAREITSEPLEMPHKVSTAQIYKRKDYDDTFPVDKEHPKSGEHYKTGSGIKDLQQVLITTGFLDEKAPNGSYGPKTEEAVTTFQKCALGKQRKLKDKIIEVSITFSGKADGIADEKTQEELKLWGKEGYEKPDIISSSRFPLEKKHRDKGYHSGARAFGSGRGGGRAHAGCDLYAPAGEKIYAIADGQITGYYDYYWQTYALVLNHSGNIVLYGEVQPPQKNHGYSGNDIPPENLRNGLPDGLKVGSIVKKGQHIGYVGQLRPLDTKTNKRYNFSDTMVHFEIYKGNADGNLTQKENKTFDNVTSKNYMRRRDLLNPTNVLDTMSDD